jgi:hypothetical protein
MQVGQFPASAANSLIEGYCEDFVSFASVLAQTLEQIAMRGLSIEQSRQHLQRIEHGMRELSTAIHDLIERNAGGAAPMLRPDARRQEPGRAIPNPATTAPVPPAPVDPASTPGAMAIPGATVLGEPEAVVLGEPEAIDLDRTAAPARQPATRADAALPVKSTEEGFHGNSESMPLRSVFQFLGRTRRSGFIRVVHGDEQLMFEVQNGCLVATTSNVSLPQERLDLLLIERKASTTDELAPILDRIPATQSDRFSEAVVAAGVVTEAQIFDALATQQKRRYSRACKASSVTYQFFEGTRKRQAFRLLPPPMPIG